jgi:DNA topoisomerase IA
MRFRPISAIIRPYGTTRRGYDAHRAEQTAKEIAARVKGKAGEVESVTTERKQTPPPQLYDLTRAPARRKHLLRLFRGQDAQVRAGAVRNP